MRRKYTASILLLAFVAASIGFPMPSFAPPGDADFPCRGHNCGCVSAEMCRTNCCCFPTMSQQSQSSCCGTQPESACETDSDETSGSFIVVIEALKCRGEAGKWLSLPPTLTVGPFVTCGKAPEKERYPPINANVPIHRSLQPESPPPRYV